MKFERGSYQHYCFFLLNKAKRLLIPYAFIAAIYAAPIHAYFFKSENLIDKYVLGMEPSQLWFLLMLFWVFALFWPISNYARKHPTFVFLICCLCYGIGVILPLPNFWNIRTGFQYMPIFYVGFLMREFGTDLIRRAPKIVYVLIDLLLFWLSAIVLAVRSSFVMKVAGLGIDFALHIVGAVMAFLILQEIVKRVHGKWLDGLSRYSMTMYLVHQQLIYFTIVWLNGKVVPILQVVLNFSFSFGISLLVAWLVSKNKFTRFLFGG